MFLLKCKTIDEISFTHDFIYDLLKILPIEFLPIHDCMAELFKVLNKHGLVPTTEEEMVLVIMALEHAKIVELSKDNLNIKLSNLIVSNFMR